MSEIARPKRKTKKKENIPEIKSNTGLLGESQDNNTEPLDEPTGLLGESQDNNTEPLDEPTGWLGESQDNNTEPLGKPQDNNFTSPDLPQCENETLNNASFDVNRSKDDPSIQQSPCHSSTEGAVGESGTTLNELVDETGVSLPATGGNEPFVDSGVKMTVESLNVAGSSGSTNAEVGNRQSIMNTSEVKVKPRTRQDFRLKNQTSLDIKTSGMQIKTVMENSSTPIGGSFLQDFLGSFEDTTNVKPAYQLPAVMTESKPSTTPEISVRDKSKNESKYMKLYPEVKMTDTLRPFTIEQLKSLYFNPLLEQREAYVDFFIDTVQKDKNEFYEILSTYYRSRLSLLAGECEVKALQAEVKRHEDKVWTIEKCWSLVYGVCGDGNKVSQNFEFVKALYSQTAMNFVCQTQRKLQQHLQENLSLYTYSASTARLQVETYIFNLFNKSSEIRGLPINAPIQASMLSVRSDSELGHQMAWLKDCISVLFTFHRKPCKDPQFVQDIHQWTTQLVATLLRVACLEDHMFLLNHVLRCPGGIIEWAIPLIQVLPPVLPSNPHLFASPLLDHCIVVLASILLPVKKRDQFLYQMKISPLTPDATVPVQPWILVDEDGEEDEDPEHSWQMLHENDIVALINQIPIDGVVKQILLITERSGELVYVSGRTSENGMLQLIAFTSNLIDICGEGLQHFNLGRYRQLNKRIGRMIRHFMHYITDHWLNVQHCMKSSFQIARIQLEYDQLFMRATQWILKATKLGSWQFMAEMPYTCVSMSMLWKLMALMHFGSWDYDHADLVDLDDQLQFEEKLTSMPTSECIYLLTTFAHMARSRSAADNLDFIKAVAIEIFQISYVSQHTRDLCCKVGRELLSSVASEHPFVLSLLLTVTRDMLDKVGNMALYLYRELPFYMWQPSDSDRLLLSNWLLETDIGSVANQVARAVISSMNWGLTTQLDKLSVDLSLHRWMALMLAEISMKRLRLGSFFAGVTAVLRQTPSGEQQFNDFMWDIALRLRLHGNSQPVLPMGVTSEFSPLDYHKDESLEDLKTSATEHNTLSCYFLLLMTSIGHDCDEFCLYGLPLLQELITRYAYRAAIQCLYNVLPMFYNNTSLLTNNTRFLGVISLVVNADVTYTKMAKNLIFSDFPGCFTKMTASMIQSQIRKAETPGGAGVKEVVELWLRCLTMLQRWQMDRNICYIIDSVLHISFLRTSTHTSVLEFFYSLYMDYLNSQKPGAGIASVVSWLATGNSAPSLIERDSLPEFPWLAYYILNAESRYEQETKLWSQLQQELLKKPPVQLDQSLKKVATNLKLPISPSLRRLTIYRWAQQANDTSLDHPLLPLLWQRFFMLYLARPDGQPPRGGVGERFFRGRTMVSFQKVLRNQLLAAVDHQQNLSATYNDIPEKYNVKEFHSKLGRLYQAMTLWLEESMLHDVTLHLPALPTQYMAEMLAPLLHNNSTMWNDYFDVQQVELLIQTSLINHWVELCKERSETLITGYSSIQQELCTEKATERIFKHLKTYAKQVAPPLITHKTQPIPDVDFNSLRDDQGIIYSLHSDLTTLLQSAKEQFNNVSRFAVLNCDFQEMLNTMNTNEHREVTLFIPCTSRVNHNHRCKGPAEVKVEYDEKQRDEHTVTKMAENRAEYNQLSVELQLPPSMTVCSAAVHVDNTIRELLILHQNDPDPAIEKAGIALFYHLVSLINNDSSSYPPTRQFFAQCIDVLGQEFLAGNPDQCQILLKYTLDYPNLAGMLAPHFIPAKSPSMFASMYNHLVRKLSSIGPDIAFVLFSKFSMSDWLSGSTSLLSKESLSAISDICDGLCFCGLTPDTKNEMLYSIFRSQLNVMINYEFPKFFTHVLNVLLKGSETQSINPECWSIVSMAFGCLDDINAAHSLFSIQQLLDVQVWLGNYFLRRRTSTPDTACFGLYTEWKNYIKHISTLFECVCQSLLMKIVLNVDSGVTPADQGLNMYLNHCYELFMPWIEPIENGPSLLSPWLEEDEDLSSTIVANYVDCMNQAVVAFTDVPHGVLTDPLNFIWQQYFNRLSIERTPEFVLQVLHSSMVQFPWHQFFPSQEALNQMTKILPSRHSSCFQFIVSVVFQFPWSRIVDSIVDNDKASTYGIIFRFFVQLSAVSNEMIIKELCKLLRTISNVFNWGHLSANDLDLCVKWFLMKCKPECVLTERSSPDSVGISLFKQAAEFVRKPDYLCSSEVLLKWRMFVHLVTQLLCKCSHKVDTESTAINTTVTNLLTDIDTVLTSVSDVTSRHYEAVSLCTEFLSILNNCKPESVECFLTATTEWLISSPDSSLLLPCITSATQSLATVSSMATVTEACLEAHFSTQAECPISQWTTALAVFNIPQNTTQAFQSSCLEINSYLSLYCFMLQRLPLSASTQDERNHLNTLLNWTAAAKPRQCDEVKLLLWWGKSLELILRQVDYGEDIKPLHIVLFKLISSLTLLGEDKATAGFMGALGLGRRSVLSIQFRLISRGLAAFISAQIPTNSIIRTLPSSDGAICDPNRRGSLRRLSGPDMACPSEQSLQALSSVESALNNKQYTSIKDTVVYVVEFIKNPSHCLRHSYALLLQLVQKLYPNYHCLDALIAKR